MFNLMGAPSRPPFSDWLAQVDRILRRRNGTTVAHCGAHPLMRSCYDVGLSPREVADDLS